MSSRKAQPQIVVTPQKPKRQVSSWRARAVRNMRKAKKRLADYVRTVRIVRPARKLRIVESVSIGEKRIIAVVQFEDQRFLVGASGISVTLLSPLEQAPSGFTVALANEVGEKKVMF